MQKTAVDCFGGKYKRVIQHSTHLPILAMAAGKHTKTDFFEIASGVNTSELYNIPYIYLSQRRNFWEFHEIVSSPALAAVPRNDGKGLAKTGKSRNLFQFIIN